MYVFIMYTCMYVCIASPHTGKIRGPDPQRLLARWLPKRLNESSSRRFDGKRRQDKHF